MRNMLSALALGSAMLLGTAGASHAFTGTWYFSNDPDYSEDVRLGDASDGSYLQLYGTENYCGRPGAPYSSMRRVMRQSNDFNGYINWRIDRDCGDDVRICVKNQYGNWACSTYQNGGWN